MSNHGLQTYDDGYAKPMRSVRPNQSMWMDRWMTTSSDRTLQAHNQMYVHDESRGNDLDLQHGVRFVHTVKPNKQKMLDINAAPCNISEYKNSWRCQREDIVVASEVPQFAKAAEVVTETKRVEITCETRVTNSRRNSKSEIQPISMFDFSKKIGSILAQKRMAVSFEHESNPQIDDFKYAATVKPSNINSLFKTLGSTPLETTFQLKEYHSRQDVAQSLLGSMDGVSSDPKFSQTTKHLYIADVSKENQIPRATTISSEFKKSAFNKLFTLRPDFDCHNECSEKLQPQGSSRNSERKKDKKTTFLALKNESSTETDTMDINVCQTWNSLPSTTSSPSYKDTTLGEKPTISHSTTQRALGSRNIELLDINRDSPPFLAAEQEIGITDLSNSRTESLDWEHLHHAEQAGNSNSSAKQCHTPSLDPSSRWVKRLRLSSSDHHAQGTKNVKMKDSLYTGKVDNLYNKMTDNSKTSLRPTFGRLFGEDVKKMKVDKMLLPSGNKAPACMDSVKECWGLNLSDPWIQRWCHNQAPPQQMKSGVPVACELDNSKTTLDEYQTKQFPSIAAMALMGKTTMNGLQSCKFHNKGSFVVWGTGGF